MDAPLTDLHGALEALRADLDVWANADRLCVAYRGGDLWWIEWDEATSRFYRVVSQWGESAKKPLGQVEDVSGIADEIARTLGAKG
jgi:hypothetical protein